MEISNKRILEQCEKIIDLKISDCYEHIKRIEDKDKYIKAFLYSLYGKAILTEEEITRYTLLDYSEEELLENCKYIIEKYEELQKIIESKLEV